MTPGAPLCTGSERMEQRRVPTAPLLAAVTENTVFPTLAPGCQAGKWKNKRNVRLELHWGKIPVASEQVTFLIPLNIFFPPPKQPFACKFAEFLHSQLKTRPRSVFFY